MTGRFLFAYDPLSSILSNIVNDAAQNNIMSRTYERNKVQNIVGQETEHGTYSYSYDDIDQLIGVNLCSSVVTNLPDESFTYDAMGNRLVSVHQRSSAVTNLYYPNSLNQYTISVHRCSSAVTNDLLYDPNGNMLRRVVPDTDGSFTTNYFTWNLEDRLTAVLDSGSNLVARYYYDPFGRRLSKKVVSGSMVTTNYYLYSDEGLIAEFDATGAVARTYGYTPNSLWGNNPVWMRAASAGGGNNPAYFYYLNDHLGAPQKLISKTGAVVWSMVSEAFGKATVDPSSTITNNLRFSSQYYDQESGLHYNTFRYYDPILGRYIKRDPIGLMGGLNVYGFVWNNATDGFDAYGWERVTLIYDMDRKFPLDYKKKHDPKGTAFIHEWRSVIDDMQKHVGDYDKECNCIESLTIIGHGSAGELSLGKLSFDVDVYEADLARNRLLTQHGLPQHEPHEEILFLKQIGGMLCEGAEVEFVTCRSGYGAGGQKLKSYLKEFLGKDTRIRLYGASVGYWRRMKLVQWWEYPLWFLFDDSGK